MRIVGGVTAQKGDFPYAVSLQLPEQGHYCGGSLLDATTVLTAAHCVDEVRREGYSPSSVSVRAGSLDWSSGGILVDVESWSTHPGYVRETYDADVGILKLSQPIVEEGGIEYAILASKGSDPRGGSMATVAGWGTTIPYGYLASAVLREVDIPIISRKRCADELRDNGENTAITENMICVGYMENGGVVPGRDACRGDSGGPLVDTKTGVLVGTVSWGSSLCGEEGWPGMFAGVGSSRDYIDMHLEASVDL